MATVCLKSPACTTIPTGQSLIIGQHQIQANQLLRSSCMLQTMASITGNILWRGHFTATGGEKAFSLDDTGWTCLWL